MEKNYNRFEQENIKYLLGQSTTCGSKITTNVSKTEKFFFFVENSFNHYKIKNNMALQSPETGYKKLTTILGSVSNEAQNL